MHICVTNASSKTQEVSCWPFWVHLYHFLRSKHQWATVLAAQAQHCRLPEIGPIQPAAWIWFSYDLWSKNDFLNYWMIVRKSNILQHVKITWDSNFSACNNILSACLPPSFKYCVWLLFPAAAGMNSYMWDYMSTKPKARMSHLLLWFG